MFSNFKQKLQDNASVKGFFTAFLILIVIILICRGLFPGWGHGDFNNESLATIAVTGNGESFGTPDIAKFTFTVQHDAKSMNEAEKAVTADANATIEKLKAAGIAEKDIKTEGFNAYPKYETKSVAMPCSPTFCPPYNPGNPVITGYTVSHTYSVKVRNIEKAGDIAQLITSTNPFSVNGPDFTFDNENALSDDARGKAITDAKEQAQVLAKQLGVHLGKIVDFQVISGNGPIYPMMYAKGASADMAESVPAPSIEPGQTDVKVQVQITYKIR